MEQDISQLFTNFIRMIRPNGFGQFINLFDQLNYHRLRYLLFIPGAAIRTSESFDKMYQIVKRRFFVI